MQDKILVIGFKIYFEKRRSQVEGNRDTPELVYADAVSLLWAIKDH
jgi:hypothetical protein